MAVSINSSLIQNINKTFRKKANTKTKSKKSVGEVITDENINKMREIAYNDFSEGREERSKEYLSFLNELRSQVAPDKAKLLAEAQSQLDKDIAQYTVKKGVHPDNLLEVILDAEGKLDSGNGSYNAHIGPTGCVDIKIYDENGEQVAGYATIGGYHEMQTSAEKQLSKFFCAVYADVYKEVSKLSADNRLNVSNTTVNLDINV